MMENIGREADYTKRDTVTGYRETGYDVRDFSKEFTMPDYVPDVRKVVNCAVRAETESIGEPEGDRIRWECSLGFTVLLLCEDGTLRSVSLAGSQTGEIKIAEKTSGTALRTTAENLSVRASDPRRLTAKCRVCVRAEGNTGISSSAPVEDRAGAAGECVERREETVGYSAIRHTRLRDNRASVDLELSAAEPEINEIIICRIDPYVTEKPVSDGAASLSGEAYAEILYSDAEGAYHLHTAKVPISTEAEVEPGAEAVFVSADIDEIKASAQTDAYGEQKVIELDFSWDADLYTVSETEAEAVKDMYSTCGDLEIKKTAIFPDSMTACFTEKLTVRGESSTEDLSASRASEIDAWLTSAEAEAVTRDENGDINVKGTVSVCILYRSADEAGSELTAEMRIPFACTRRSSGNGGEGISYRVCADVAGCRVSMNGDKVAAETDVAVSVFVWEPHRTEIVSGAVLTPSDPVKRPPLTLYYVKEGDDLWSIAKKYRVPVNALLEENGMTPQELKSRKVIAVPTAENPPSFTKII